jgi:superfamily II DNA or RNA helicase
VANDNDSRYDIVRDIAKNHKRIIIFYNFSYELRRLRQLAEELEIVTGEWNGELHTEVPGTDKWFYLVQYSAGCEGWNCITTDTMIFFSQSYSYRMMKQAEGRINRMNTPYEDLYYYHLTSAAPIDLAIKRALTQKRNFNENTYLKVRRRYSRISLVDICKLRRFY